MSRWTGSPELGAETQVQLSWWSGWEGSGVKWATPVGGCGREIPVPYIGRGNGRATGACCEGEGEAGYGGPACRWAGGCLASLSCAGGLWGQAGWTMVAPGRLTGTLAMCTTPLGTYGTKRKKKNPELEKAAGERHAVCGWQTACLVGRERF